MLSEREEQQKKHVEGQRRERKIMAEVCVETGLENPDTASVAGLWLPKQQWVFYDCQTVSFQEDGRNYIFTLPVGRDSNCCRCLNKI